MVGSPGDKEAGPNAGAIYVFQAAADGMRGWQRLDQSGMDSNEAGDNFGHAVAIGNLNTSNYYTNEIVVGAPMEDLEAGEEVISDAGWIYTFQLQSGTFQPLYGLSQSVVGADNAAGDYFGWALLPYRMPGGPYVLLVSAPGDNRPTGADAGEVLFFLGSPGGPIPAGDPTTPDYAWAYGSDSGQRLGIALAIDRDNETLMMSGTGADYSGIVNGYLAAGPLVPELTQETTVYDPA